MRTFHVADFSASGELIQSEVYANDWLERVPGAALLIGDLAGNLYRSPESFDLDLVADALRLTWRSCSPTGGIMTLRFRDPGSAAPDEWSLATFSLLLSGLNADDDAAIVTAAQGHLVDGLHNTGFEPAFDLRQAHDRPLVASFCGVVPPDPERRQLVALCDRCFAAAYFRQQRLV